MNKIGLGGGCHWCTEGVFLSLKGVKKVEQGWISPKGETNSWSEAIIVHFDSTVISQKEIIEIHLHTHASTSNHSKRPKYRSAVYVFNEEQKTCSSLILTNLQVDFKKKLITQTLLFGAFKENEIRYQSYLFKNPNKPFCVRYIHPKIILVKEKFDKKVDSESIPFLAS